MDSVQIPKEEVKLNTPVTVPYIIPSSYFSTPFFPRLSNPDAKEANENVSGEGEGK